MSNINPLVQSTAPQTINCSIDAIQLLTTLLDNTVKWANSANAGESADDKHMSAAEVAALSLQLSGVQSVLEQGYAQCIEAGGKSNQS
ncbi:MAG: hypothetical protein ACI9FJ_000785 [Alteromonadaceae bacterium]|jgi:hypothetical protein